MPDAGVLLSLPTESIAIRVVIASVAAVILARLLLWAGLRVPRVRALTALVPAMALLAVTLLFSGSLRLPYVMMPVEAVDALPVPVRDSYLHFAPIAAPLLVGLWALVATIRIAVRCIRAARTRREAAAAFTLRTTADDRIRHLVRVLAGQLRVSAPPVAVIDGCPGGATVVGIRRPVLVVDQALVRRLDAHELQGVLAHELAHVKRRDNLVALALGTVRDLAFFVPGGRWALRQLHAERELAADQLAVATTRRPAALASGLLKVVDASDPRTACAALMPRGSLVGRVELLIDDRPPVGRLRGGIELLAVTLAVTAAVAAAVRIPAMIAGAGERDALAVLFPAVAEPAEVAEPTAPEPRAFQVYREVSRIEQTAPESTPVRRTPVLDDDPDEVRPSALRACATGLAGCHSQPSYASLGLTPPPIVRTDQGLVDRWRVRPVVATDDGLAVYWLSRLQ